jgi:hypothetical protein
MKTPLRAAAIAAALSLAGAASAQQQPGRVRVGLGVGLPTSELSSLSSTAPAGSAGLLPAQLYVPIDLGSFRLEPELGFIAVSQDGGSSASYWAVGTGAFYLMQLAEQARLYVGGRLVIGLEDRKDVGGVGGGNLTSTTHGTDAYLAATFGGEVLLHPRVGLGAEAQLGHWWIGERKTSSGGVTATEPGGSSWQTQGVIFVRLYFT